MAQPITINSGVEIGSGIEIGNHSIYNGQQTQFVQNVAGTDGATGFFFLGGGGWTHTPTPSFYDIEPGWYVVNLAGATVVSTDPALQTVTITGDIFTSGEAYSFSPTPPTPGPT